MMRKRLYPMLILFSLTGCVSKKEKLVEKIYSLGYPTNEVVVSLEDFFEGNYDRASIGPNIHVNQPSPQEFFRRLKELRNSENVDDVLVRILDVEDLDWPFTDAVYVISTYSSEVLRLKLAFLRPDGIYEEWMYGEPVNAPPIKPGYTVHSVWWD